MTTNYDFLSLYEQRTQKQITREEYWSSIQEFLRSLTNFKNLLELFDNKIQLNGNRIIMDLQISKSHKRRIKMVLDHNDIRSVPFSVLSEGFYESFQADVLIELGKHSTQFLDIGANAGFYSLAICIENELLKVISFEPQPKVFEIFNENISLNKLANRIDSRNIALGHEKDTLTMYVPKFTGTSGASFRDLHSEEGISEQITVPVDVLDFQVSEKSVWGELLMKIDCEGSELNIILGADSLLRNNKPTIMVELLRKWMKPFGHSPQMFLDHMLEHGYKCLVISDGFLFEITSITEQTIETNFIFVHLTNKNHQLILNRFLK